MTQVVNIQFGAVSKEIRACAEEDANLNPDLALSCVMASLMLNISELLFSLSGTWKSRYLTCHDFCQD